MGRRAPQITSDAACDTSGLQELQQADEDQQYIDAYYEKASRKRKQYRENKREKLWQAEERLSMGKEDVNVNEKKKAEKLSRAKGDKKKMSKHFGTGSLPKMQ